MNRIGRGDTELGSEKTGEKDLRLAAVAPLGNPSSSVVNRRRMPEGW